ncbi:MAG TPA: phytanoyl-CoA dioxygenase family protein [Nannocystis sp.]|jgi:ectoine hydroxylase
MALTSQQIEEFQQRGFLLLEDRFSPAEMQLLTREVGVIVGQRSERTVMEASGSAVRSVYAPHVSDPVFSVLARDPRLVEPARSLLGGDIYVYQSKLNIKSPFVGEVWEWHQDYVFWHNEDKMPAARVLSAAVFLDDVNEFNGPMVLIPGSHRQGVLACPDSTNAGDAGQSGPAWRSHVSARLKYTIDRAVLQDLAGKHGLYAPKARAGSILLFDSNIAHASAANISPFARSLIFYTYNHVDNAPPQAMLTRPDFLVSRDSRALAVASDDDLMNAATTPAANDGVTSLEAK